MLDTFFYYLQETIKETRKELARQLGKFVTSLPRFKPPITAVHLGMEMAGEVIPKIPVSARSSPAGCLATLLVLLVIFIIVAFSILPALEKSPSPARVEALINAARDPLDSDNMKDLCDTAPILTDAAENKEFDEPVIAPTPAPTPAPQAPKQSSRYQVQKSKGTVQGSACDCNAPKVIWHDEQPDD